MFTMEEDDLLISRIQSRDSVINEPSLTKAMQSFVKYLDILENKEDGGDLWEEDCVKALDTFQRELHLCFSFFDF